jgi:AraC-like DNA-binding protein
MDPVSGLLDGPRAHDAFVLRMLLSPPWSMLIEDRAPVSAIALVRGTAWIVPTDAEPIELLAGDVALVRGPDPYVFADTPATRAQVRIDADQVCHPLLPDAPGMTDFFGVHTWGNDPEGSTVAVSGSYRVESELGRPLLESLPPVVLVRGDSELAAVVQLLTRLLDDDQPGQAALLDRTLDLVLMTAFRAWLRSDLTAPRWFNAQGDRTVGAALQHLHHDPARAWTVDALAREVGSSRARLAQRFGELVGQPPMRYLAQWRLALAADLLRDGDDTLARVAETVGYGSAFALSTAFSRERGESPRDYRRRMRPRRE